MSNRKPYPILSALKREGDTLTLCALRLWWTDYHETPPQVAANDNDPAVRPTELETYRYELDAMPLIITLAEDENNKDGPKHVKQYSASTHNEVRKPQIRRTNEQIPPSDGVDAEAEMARCIDAKKMREWLGADSTTLDMAIGPHTYLDVGRAVGAEGSAKTVYRAGRQEVKDVAKIFKDEAA